MTAIQNPPEHDPQDHPAGRVEGISTDTRALPQPVEHGATGQIVLNDLERDVDEISWSPGEFTQLPDGSLYQTARAAWLELDPDDQTAVLERDYRPEWFDDSDPDRVAVTLTSSRWKAGTGEGDDYTPYYKYDLTLRPVDEDGEIRHSDTPIRSLSCKIHPQYSDMRYKDGNELELPFGTGTLVHISSTYISDHETLEIRAIDVLEDVLDYDVRPFDIHPESRRDWKAEVYHRIAEERIDDVIATIRQSQELIPHHGGDVETGGRANGGDWVEIRIDTDDWQHLGFPSLDLSAYIKVYYMDQSEALEYPFDQPKVETGVLGTDKWAADQFGDVLNFLREILMSHLEWAGIRACDLVSDDISEGSANPRYEWEHPEGRRAWLREHYESFVPDLYREANRERSKLCYDILQVLRERGSATYREIAERTGAAVRTVREHVRRLCQIGPKDEPGVLHRKRGAVTLVTWAPEMRDLAEDVLDESYPDDTRDDLRRRREQRREDRRERERDQEDVDDRDISSSSTSSSSWRRADRLDYGADEIGQMISDDYLDLEDVRINISPYNWIHDPGG